MNITERCERLEKELDAIGLPKNNQERIASLAKLLRIQPFKAEAVLKGHLNNPEIVTKLAHELEVSEEWLLGLSDSNKRAPS